MTRIRAVTTCPADRPGDAETGIHAGLKQATAGLHRRVERRFDLKRRVATLAGYRDALATLRGIHMAVQQAFERLEQDGVVVERGRCGDRIGWLDEDLKTLGGKILGGPLPTSAPPQLHLGTAAEALGCRYVIEGSALGGQYIFRNVCSRFGLDDSSGARYFRGHGDRTGAAWAAFVAELDGQPAAIADGAARGARATFLLFDTGLSGAAAIQPSG